MERGNRQNYALHALRLTISDALQDGAQVAEMATTGISEAVIAGRIVPGLDEIVNAAYLVISNVPDDDPDIFNMARIATINVPWTMALEDVYIDINKSLLGTHKKLAHAASRKAATDAFFEVFGRDAVSAVRSVRYNASKLRPSTHFIKMYRTAHHDMTVAAREARGPDKMNDEMAVDRLNEICSGAIAQAAEESWDGIRFCAIILAILERTIMEDTEESVTDAANRAANTITNAVANDPQKIIVHSILKNVIPKVAYYNSRKRAHDAAVREIHRLCTDMLTDAVGMCIVEALYGVLMAGAYRTATNKAFFRASYRSALELACIFDPQTDVAGFKKDVSLPSHKVTQWWMSNTLPYLMDVDYVSAARSQENAAVMVLYEASYEAAFASASKAAYSKTNKRR